MVTLFSNLRYAVVATVALLRNLRKTVFDVYRPERYYMRGPGPKWREKHPQPAATM